MIKLDDKFMSRFLVVKINKGNSRNKNMKDVRILYCNFWEKK